LLKKSGYKIIQHKKLLDKYLEGQIPKVKRQTIKYNWKMLFGTGQL
jgi:hypothetical protein